MQISMMLVRALTAAVERAGIERGRFLEEIALSEAQLTDPDARVPLLDYKQMIAAAYRVSADPAFGLHMGERIPSTSFDVLGHLTEHSASLRDALEVSVRYSRIVSAAPRLSVIDNPASVTVRIDLPDEDGPAVLLTAEFALVALLRMVRIFVGETAVPKRAYFVHQQPAHHREYERFFGGRELFSQDFTGLELDRAWLDCAPVCRYGELQDFLQTRAELLLAKVNREQSAAERVRVWLAAQADLTRPTLHEVARELGTSARTLRRRLHNEQVQFSSLLDSARAEQAKRMLADSKVSIQDAAYALGFGTPSAFSRAFKRWTGVAPKAFRPRSLS